MRKLIIIIFVLLISFPVHAYKFGENWTKTDTSFQVTYIAITTVDFAQTRWMARQDWQWDGNNYKEFCPLFFNDKPHEDATWLIPAGMVLHTLIALALPPSYKVLGYDIHPRRTWQVFWIGIETGAVGNNFNAGVRIEF